MASRTWLRSSDAAAETDEGGVAMTGAFALDRRARHSCPVGATAGGRDVAAAVGTVTSSPAGSLSLRPPAVRLRRRGCGSDALGTDAGAAAGPRNRIAIASIHRWPITALAVPATQTSTNVRAN